jgi:hypothetical protein
VLVEDPEGPFPVAHPAEPVVQRAPVALPVVVPDGEKPVAIPRHRPVRKLPVRLEREHEDGERARLLVRGVVRLHEGSRDDPLRVLKCRSSHR